MQNQSQYGETILLRDIRDPASAQVLKRIHFSARRDESGYDEAWLQHLIMSHPGLLPVGQIEPAFSDMVPVCTELPMRAGFVDNLFVTPAGDIALIECKLWRNPESRRKVIAQIIDYASEMKAWDYEALDTAIRRARPADQTEGSSTSALYEVVSAGREMDEVAFHDAVSRNLRRGRFLLLIVGDGIREGVETMTEFLQQNAGLHFTLSVVELALFEMPTAGYVAQPRVIARTMNIERGVVTLNDSRMDVISGREALQNPSLRPTTITQEHFFEDFERNCPGFSEKLFGLLDSLEAYHIQADYNPKTLTLRWHGEDSKNWNLGTISNRGEVWMDYHVGQARNSNRLDASKQYLQSIADSIPGASLKQTRNRTAWNLADRNGHALRVDALLADEARRDAWIRAIAAFQQKVAETSEA